MDPRWLEAFIALAETHSIRAAAARLNLSPATLSDRISALEGHLGVSLLVRGVTGTGLSERGAIYYTEAVRLLKDWGRITEQVRQLSETPSTHLRMVFHGHIMPPPPMELFLRQFLNRHYHVIPELYDDREFGIEDGLRSGKLDLYFAFCPPTLELPGIVHQTVYTTRLCAVVPDGHHLAKREAISLSELDGETLFLSPESRVPYLRRRAIDALQAAGIRYSVPEGNFSPRLQSMLVSLERGVAILPHSQCFSVPGQVTVLPLTDPLCHCSMEMLSLTENNNPALRQFLAEFNSTERGEQG